MYKGKVYFTTNSGVYSYSNNNVESLEYDTLSFNGIKLDEVGYIWFYGDDFLLGYDSINFKNYDLSPYAYKSTKLSEIFAHKEYLWLSFGSRKYNYKYAVINVDENTLNVFKPEETGFEWEYRKFLGFYKGNAWIDIASGGVFKYDFIDEKWNKENNETIFPHNTRIASNVVTDSSGKMWFVMNDINKDYIYKIATYEGGSNSIEIKFDSVTLDKKTRAIQLYKFGEEVIIVTSKGLQYSIKNGKIEPLYELETELELSQESNLYKNGENIFRLANVTRNEEPQIEIIDVDMNKKGDYVMSQNTYFPFHTLGSYYKMDGMEFISWFNNNIYLIKKDGIWQGVSAMGIENDDDVEVKIDEKGNYYFYDKYVYKYESGIAKNLFRFSPDHLRGVEVFDDNLNFYYSYRIGSHDVNYNLQREFGVRIGKYDFKGQKTMELTQENSCLSSWYEIGKYSTYSKGPVPKDMKIDNYGNKWCLTWTSIYKIDENLNCTYFDFDEENEEGEEVDNPLPNQIAYSRYQGKMYGRHDNIVYSFGDTNYRKTDSEDMVDGELNFIGECNDGLVYVATTDGRLFRLNTIDSWEKIPLVEGKENIHANIRNVFRSEDTLYVSTEIGLIKVHQKITSVDEGSTELAEINVFPNPVDDKLALTGYEGRALIYNSIGTEVKAISTSKSDINVSDLAPGIYFITDVYGMLIAKFVKE